MLIAKGIGLTDELNRKNHVIPVETITKAYLEANLMGIPMFYNHDHTRPIGWSFNEGIYCEPSKSYMLTSSQILETPKEMNAIIERIQNYYYTERYLPNIDKYKILEEKIGKYLSDTKKVCWKNGVSYYDKNIVLKVLPNLKEELKDGLISLDRLEILQPGVYKIDDYLLFAHVFFRKGFDRKNSLNKEFLAYFQSLVNSDNQLKVALDLDMIGLAGTEVSEEEYDYWWGPKFDDQLDNIQFGVTRHENTHSSTDGLVRMEFGWYQQDDRRTFECEEIYDRPNIKNENYGCRFVHSMVSPETNIPYHLDGAIRSYTDEKMLNRLEVNMDQSGRDTDYTKIWRIDGIIPVPKWKALINYYYRGNELVGEYFSSNTSEDLENKHSTEINELSTKDEQVPHIRNFVPNNMEKEEGIRFGFKVLPHNKSIQLKEKQACIYSGNLSYFENDTVTIIKLLRRNGLYISYPEIPIIMYEDLITNFPIIVCKDQKDADVVLSSFIQLCRKWSEEKADRLVSFAIRINYLENQLSFSFAGHVLDLVKFFEFKKINFPEYSNVANWVQKIRNNMEYLWGVKSTLKPWELFKENGQLYFERNIIKEKFIEKLECDDFGLKCELNIPLEERKFICEKSILVAPIFQLERSNCSRCNEEYKECNCIKFVDDNITEIIESASIHGLFWTLRRS